MIRLLAILWITLLVAPVHADEIHYNRYGMRIGKTTTQGNVQTHYNAQGVRTGKSLITDNRLTTYDAMGRRTSHSISNPHGKTRFDYHGVRTGGHVGKVEYDRLHRRTGSVKLDK